MLNAHGVAFEYREYTKDPLSPDEIRAILAQLGVSASALVRKRDKAFAANNLTGGEPDDVLVPLMAQHPGLLQRPIAIAGGRAVVGRPVDNLRELF